MVKEESEDREDPITSAMIIKWGGICFATVSLIVSLVWFIASMKADIITIQQQGVTARTALESRDLSHDKELDRLRDKEEANEKAVSDLVRKVDIAVAILERIERRVGPN